MANLVKRFSIFVLALTFSAAAMPLYAFDHHEGSGDNQEADDSDAAKQPENGEDQQDESDDESDDKKKKKKKKEKPKCQPTGSRLQRC